MDSISVAQVAGIQYYGKFFFVMNIKWLKGSNKTSLNLIINELFILQKIHDTLKIYIFYKRRMDVEARDVCIL